MPDVRARSRWYLNRLKCMSAAEIRFRALRALAVRAESVWRGSGRHPPTPQFTQTETAWIHTDAAIDAEPYLRAAERIVAGKLDIFSLRSVSLGDPPRWNRDPKTGREAPLVFGKLLDYRDPGRVGDIKYLWEPNRHQHLVTLAQAHASSGDARYFDALRAHLNSWFAACPYGLGPNWSSALEPAVRLINWALAWQFLGGRQGAVFGTPEGSALQRRWVDSVYQHARFIRGHFSLHSSANNHLIGEAAGLFVAGLTWPYWPELARWRAEAQHILEREVLLQNAPDGVNLEQAVAYQQFELDLLLLSVLAARANEVALAASLEQRLRAMLDYVAAIMDVAGNVPMIGDSDDGFLVKLSQEERFCSYRSLLATGAVLFDSARLKEKAGGLDDKTRWLLGRSGEAKFRSLSAAGTAHRVPRAFPQGGYYVLGCRFESPDEIRLIADAGALGYGRIAAHGHADALAFTLSVGGQEIFVDPGTYTYRAGDPWRDYFRSTAAHNTARVDGQNQSVAGGNFMWLAKAEAACTLWRTTPARDVFEGRHDGYRRLPDPVIHKRRITLDKAARRIVIEDRFEMGGPHDVDLHFHCGAECGVSPRADLYSIERGGVQVALRPPRAPGAVVRIRQGERDPILGWQSRGFGDKRPAPTIAWHARLSGHTVLRTEIRC